MRALGERRNHAMETIARVLLVAMLACGAGCTTPPDWIQRTLVTVDVTGHWHGVTLARTGTYTVPEVWLDLKQEGPKATGSMLAKGRNFVTGPVPIEGTIAGDVFRFRQANGPARGELTVRGDEMTGEVTIGDSVPMTLSRGESSPRPAPKQP
jgi:hypothetical protein